MANERTIENMFEEINLNNNCHILAHMDSEKIYFYSKDQQDRKIFKNIINILRSIFLPEGFPQSVSKDYIPYQLWDTLQAFSSTITGALSTHAILAGVGVGNETATPLSATITWILKEGTGHIGRILFAWWKGSDLDINSKRWRLVADILNDVAMGIEVLVLPLYVTWSTEILCFTTAIKSIVGVAGGATRVALTQHHALRGNLADVSAKDGSQETFVNLCASVVALLILLTITNKIVAFFWFAVFTMLHLYANYNAVKSIRLKVLNTSRLLAVYENYIANENVPTVDCVNFHEPLFRVMPKDFQICGHHIKIGKSLKKIIANNLHHLKQSKIIYKNEQFIINVYNDSVYISLSKEHSDEVVLQAYFHALIVGIMTSSDRINRTLAQNLLVNCGIDITLTHAEIFEQSKLAWKRLRKALDQKGWSTNQHLLPIGECRMIW